MIALLAGAVGQLGTGQRNGQRARSTLAVLRLIWPEPGRFDLSKGSASIVKGLSALLDILDLPEGGPPRVGLLASRLELLLAHGGPRLGKQPRNTGQNGAISGRG
jgi:hypothetical protein